MRLSFLFCLALALLAGCLNAEPIIESDVDETAGVETAVDETAVDETDQNQPNQTNDIEKLLAQPPSDYTSVYQFNNRDTRLSEFVPSGETLVEWATKVTFESHAHLADSDPIDILTAEAERLRENCSFVSDFNLFSGFENNYPTSVRLIFCGSNKLREKGEVSLTKVVQGLRALYVVRVTRLVDEFEQDNPKVSQDEIASWSTYLSLISVCHVSDGDHPCPPKDGEE